MPIRKLSPLLVNQIAAGEVIERPASVVKELVENCLDAGARRIDVAVEEGGRQLIRVSDDGSGIPEAELPLALAPHATSKLDKPEQLSAIGTLGFRGEALASIASVSRLRLTSRRNEHGTPVESGAVIEAEGDHVGDARPTACAPGAVVEVRDLFFNTPARRKFLRASATEMAHLTEAIARIAMVRHDVAFSLRHGERKVLDLPAETTRRPRCLAILGKELDEALLEFEHVESPRFSEEDGGPSPVPATVWGLAGLPIIARASGKFQHLCINGRPIRDRNLAHAIKEAYRGLIPPDKYPLAVVMVEVPPDAVDVNVHPAKAEVRFRDPSRMHGLVLTALRQRLLGADLTPRARTFPNHNFQIPNEGPDTLDASSSSLKSGGPQASSLSPSLSPSSFVDYFRQMAPRQKGFVYEQVKAAMGPRADAGEPLLEQQAGPGNASGAASGVTSGGNAWDEARANAGRDSLPPAILRAHGVLQVHKSYLVTQDDDGLVIIDQHALHERVMFEELRKRVMAKPLESQRLLMPATISATARRIDLLDHLKPLLDQIGVEAAAMGPATIGIHAFPTLLFDRKVEPQEFLVELLDRAEEGELDLSNPNALEASLHEVLDMMACKAAVKAGDAMTPEELAALLSRRDEIERGGSCPHGRPTTIRLTLHDLEKHFKRT